jgi:GNAT superfamily N-acetyltransferase
VFFLCAKGAAQVVQKDWNDPYCTLQLKLNLNEYTEEPSAYVRDYEGKILVMDDDRDCQTGKIALRIVELSRAYVDGVSTWDVLDSVDGALARFAPLVTPRTGVYVRAIQRIAREPIGCLLLVDSIKIAPRWRGRGVGRVSLKIACDRFGTFCSLAALRAFPLQWEGRVAEGPREFRRDRAKLVKHYEKMGFTRIPRGDIMVKPLPGSPWH